MAVPDNETKANIFPGKVIIVEHGKLSAHPLYLSGRFPLAHHYRAVLAGGS